MPRAPSSPRGAPAATATSYTAEDQAELADPEFALAWALVDGVRCPAR